MKLKPNLSVFDRIVRLAVGVGCVYVGFIDQSIVQNTLLSVLVGMFGLVNVFAFFTSHCPVYAVCGVNTHKSKLQEG